MKQRSFIGVSVLIAGIACGTVSAQIQDATPSASSSVVAPASNLAPETVVLEWTPPALSVLSAQATTKSSFTLDRTMLAAASALLGEKDQETRQAIAKIDGVSVHLLRFGAAGIPDETPVSQIREAYHQRGWKHLVSTSTATVSGSTDVWFVLDGVNVRGAVVLVESPKSLTLATMAGNLSPVDLLHLRGHFGIPRFDADGFKEAKDK